jgi:uncharacterized small protein (DUF1192 family)
MDFDELEPRRTAVAPEDLSALGMAELKEYIARLESEIERARGVIAAKEAQKSAAEAVFRKR